MIVVDASALVAIGDLELDAATYLQAIASASGVVISPVNATETGLILIGRGRLPDVAGLAAWLSQLSVEVFDRPIDHASALSAYLSYGRGFHPARLNLGDCFAYALARQLDAPLLYKGDDFAKTDIRSALQPT